MKDLDAMRMIYNPGERQGPQCQPRTSIEIDLKAEAPYVKYAESLPDGCQKVRAVTITAEEATYPWDLQYSAIVPASRYNQLLAAEARLKEIDHD